MESTDQGSWATWVDMDDGAGENSQGAMPDNMSMTIEDLHPGVMEIAGLSRWSRMDAVMEEDEEGTDMIIEEGEEEEEEEGGW